MVNTMPCPGLRMWISAANCARIFCSFVLGRKQNISSLSLSPLSLIHIYLLYVISDLERISDRCRNLAELSEQMLKEESTFSIGGYEDLENLNRQCLSTLQAALNCWKETELERYYEQTKRSEQKVNEMENQLRDKHIRRLSLHKCEVSAGVIFLDAISYLAVSYTHLDVYKRQGFGF